MKKQFFAVALLLMGFGMMFLTSCKDDDTTAPTITLTGASTMTVQLGDAFVDPGFTAEDDEDGDVTANVVITNLPNTNQVNIYEVTYTVEDEAGNTASAVRTVTVPTDRLAGNYAVHDVVTGGAFPGEYDYNVVVTQSGTDYNKLIITNFGGYGNPVVVNAFVTGANVSIPAQTPAGLDPTVMGSISGFGTYEVALVKGLKNITYTNAFTAGGSESGNATYTKQ